MSYFMEFLVLKSHDKLLASTLDRIKTNVCLEAMTLELIVVSQISRQQQKS